MRMGYFVLEAGSIEQPDKYLQEKSTLSSYLKLATFPPYLFVTFMNKPSIKEDLLRKELCAQEDIGSLAPND